jgi:DNA repair exonuclease SbcCD ATPase subunit
MQKYIHEFFSNTDVELRLDGADINILINSNGIQKKVTSLSGGEKKRLNIAIQLGLYDLIQATSQVSFNMLWLDEIESELDPVGVQQLINIIEDKSDTSESVYWITNHPAVKENIQNKIICTKSLGVTTIEEK